MAAARGVLESAALTRAGKRAIAAYKAEGARKAIAAALVRVCSDECARLAASGDTSGWAVADAPAPSRNGPKNSARAVRRPVRVTSAASCEVCGGSNNRRAALAARSSLLRANARRVLVVGGTATQQTELRALLGGGGIALQFVDGTSHSHSQRDAIANMRRSDVVVIWGSTPLRHAVSDLYTEAPVAGVRTITVARRGIEALCREVVRSFGL